MYDVVTNYYRQKIAQASAGTATLPVITTIVVGTGGTDANGNPLQPSGSDTSLYNQVLSKATSAPAFPSQTSAQFSITVNPADLPSGNHINEIGLKDSTGALVAKSTFYDKITDGTTTMTFNIQPQF